MPKNKIRAEIKKIRDNLSRTDKYDLDNNLNQALLDFVHDLGVKTVAAFHPHKSEPNIIYFLDSLVENGYELFLPRVNGDNLDLVQVQTVEEVETGKFGINEPVKHLSPTHLTDFDLILVPGLAFGMNGHRIGYGRGFYDRLLSEVRGLKVGVGYSFQIVDEVPFEEHDVKLDVVISENGFVKMY